MWNGNASARANVHETTRVFQFDSHGSKIFKDGRSNGPKTDVKAVEELGDPGDRLEDAYFFGSEISMLRQKQIGR